MKVKTRTQVLVTFKKEEDMNLRKTYDFINQLLNVFNEHSTDCGDILDEPQQIFKEDLETTTSTLYKLIGVDGIDIGDDFEYGEDD